MASQAASGSAFSSDLFILVPFDLEEDLLPTNAFTDQFRGLSLSPDKWTVEIYHHEGRTNLDDVSHSLNVST